MLYWLLAWAFASGYLAIRSRNILLRLGSSIAWLAILALILSDYGGRSWTTFAVLGSIAMAIALPLSLFERLIDFSPRKKYTSLYDESGTRLEAAEGEQPTGVLTRFMNRVNMNQEPPPRRPSGESAEEYRARVKSALGRKR